MVARMSYMDMFVSEVLRMHPIAKFVKLSGFVSLKVSSYMLMSIQFIMIHTSFCLNITKLNVIQWLTYRLEQVHDIVFTHILSNRIQIKKKVFYNCTYSITSALTKICIRWTANFVTLTIRCFALFFTLIIKIIKNNCLSKCILDVGHIFNIISFEILAYHLDHKWTQMSWNYCLCQSLVHFRNPSEKINITKINENSLEIRTFASYLRVRTVDW